MFSYVFVIFLAKRAFRCTAPTIWNSLPKTKTLLPFLNLGYRHSFTSRLNLFSFLTLTSTLPGHSASEVTTIRRYTNICIIIIFLDPGTSFPGCETLSKVCGVWNGYNGDSEIIIRSLSVCRSTFVVFWWLPAWITKSHILEMRPDLEWLWTTGLV